MADKFYGIPIPGVDTEEEIPGKLIALEGTDGVGRSTQTRMLRNWLESSGLAVYDTGLRRGTLAGRDIQRAKEGHTMGRRTQCLFYATDFADRLQNEILPSLCAGYVVLTDRYTYSLMARAAVRGLDRQWLQKLYAFALKPDLVLYMKTSMDKLLPRVLGSGGFDYWESGMDFTGQDNMYESFVQYQRDLLAEFDRLAREYQFTLVDANRCIGEVFQDLRAHVEKVVQDMSPAPHHFTDFVGSPATEPEEAHSSRGGSLTDRLRDLLASFLDEN